MKGRLFWITGLSGAGKTTIGTMLYQKLKEKYPNTVLLDGDVWSRWLEMILATRKKRDLPVPCVTRGCASC